MTINSDTRKAGPYLGDGATTTLPFGFKVFQASDLRVVRTDSAGVESELVLGSDFTANLNANQDTTPGGSITLATPAASGTRTTIGSDIAALQKIQLTNNGGFYADVLNGGLDRLTILIQQLIEEQSRSLRVPFSDIAGGTEMANSVDRASKVLGFDSSGRPVYTVPASGSAADVALQLASLITDLANIASAAKGSALSGFNPAMAYTGQTAGAAMRAHGLPLAQCSGADPTGTADSTSAATTAGSTSASTGRPVVVNGSFRHTSQLTLAAGACYQSSPAITEAVGVAAPGRLVKDFNGVGVVVTGDAAAITGLQIDSATGRSGDGLQVLASRVLLSDIAVTRAGGAGVRINADAGSYNTNLFDLRRIIAIGNGSDGIRVDDPTGATDACGGLIVGADLRSNGGDGLRAASGTWNTYIGLVAQGNAGYGVRLTAADRSSLILGGDLEGNTTGQGVIEAGSFGHIIVGPFYGSVPAFVDNSGYPGRNVVMQWDPDAAKITWGEEINLCAPRAAALVAVNGYTGTAKRNVGRIAMYDSGTAGGTVKVYTLTNGGTVAPALQCDELQRTWHRAAVADTLIAVPYSASITIDASLGNAQTITATSGAAFTVNAPSNPLTGQLLEITIRNTSGGALGTVTWAAVFKMRTWVPPGNGSSRAITFRFDGSAWVEKTRTEADVPN